jgi:thermitase
MRVFVSLLALALATPVAAASSTELETARANASRQLIVQFSRTALPREAVSSRRRRLEARCIALGLRVVGALDDRLPAPSAALRAPASRRSIALDLDPFDPARIWLLEAPDARAAAEALAVLANDHAIDWVETNSVREAAMELEPGADLLPFAPPSLRPEHFPDDPMFWDTRQWGLRNVGPYGRYRGVAGADVHALEGWTWSRGSNDILLAIGDTGIDPDQPELQTTMPDGGSRIVYAMNVTSEPSDSIRDSHGHGTAVTGVFGALTNNGAVQPSLGVAGVCGGDGRANFGCRIVPIKITHGHDSYATAYDISRAILYATRVGARAMNLSFGGLSASRLERLALLHAIKHGCVVVAAAGNFAGLHGGVDPVYPAAYSVEGLCIQVGATNPRDERAFFSSHGPGLDLMAPGVDVWTTSPTYPTYYGAVYNGFLPISGTSLAAPFVTGAVGLLAALRPELADTDFQHVLREGADDLGAPGVDDTTGWGRMNLGRALASVRSEMGIWHDEVDAQTMRPLRTDSLIVGEGGFGNLDQARLAPLANLIEATATVAIPDSFIDSVRVWTRVGGTTTISGDFRVPYFAPWARVVSIDATSFTLRGYVYHLLDCLFCTVPEDAHVPLPVDQTRFGFTVIGRVDRPPSLIVRAPARGVRVTAGDTLEVAWEASDPDQVTAIEIEWRTAGRDPVRIARLPGDRRSVRIAASCPRGTALAIVALDEHGRRHDRAEVVVPIAAGAPCPPAATVAAEPRPNPFRGNTRIEAPLGSQPIIVDVTGRRVRRLVVSETGVAEWDGRDDHGSAARPGLYFVRWNDRRGRVERKVVKIE